MSGKQIMKQAKPKKGKLLLSAPFLNDIFKRSVIYLTEHNDEGSIGFIVNKPLKMTASDVIEDLSGFKAPVFLGGPVQQEMLNFIHKAGDKIDGGLEIGNGLFWGGNFETVKILAASGALDPMDFRFYMGYAGWSPGQLEDEMDFDSWIVTDFNESRIFDRKTDSMWSDLLRDMGGEFKIISTFPEDPSVN
jgi:putative transcriptional regulator